MEIDVRRPIGVAVLATLVTVGRITLIVTQGNLRGPAIGLGIAVAAILLGVGM